MKQRIFVLLVLVFSLPVFQSVVIAQSPDELLIFAASSLTDSFIDIADQFELEHNVQITLNFAGSSTLAAQLLQGAPADILASANEKQVNIVIEDGLIVQDDVIIFAENELVIIVPIDNPADISTAEDLTNDDLVLVLASPTVPIREYTDLWIETVTPVYGNNFSDQLLANVVSEEQNVRQIVARIALGEADAGIVYRTDVTPELASDVTIIELPEDTSPRAVYPIAPLIDSVNSELASEFIEFLVSEAGQNILQSWGFCQPEMLYPEMIPEPEMTLEPDETQTPATTC